VYLQDKDVVVVIVMSKTTCVPGSDVDIELQGELEFPFKIVAVIDELYNRAIRGIDD
jgi:hypothetical protein